MPEVHSESRQTSKMGAFCKDSEWLRVVNYYRKNFVVDV